MKIESFTFKESNHQGSATTSFLAQVSSRIKIRNFQISVKGVQKFDLSFKIVCTPEELYFPAVQGITDNCLITDPAAANKKIEIIEFLRLHANQCEKIKEFLALVPNTPAQCSSTTSSNSNSKTQSSDLASQLQVVQIELEKNQKELARLKELGGIGLTEALDRLNQRTTEQDEGRDRKLRQPNAVSATNFLNSREGLFSSNLPKNDVHEWINKQLVPDFISNSRYCGTSSMDDVMIDVRIPTLILIDKQNMEHTYTNVRFKQAANEPLSRGNLLYEAVAHRDLGNNNSGETSIPGNVFK